MGCDLSFFLSWPSGRREAGWVLMVFFYQGGRLGSNLFFSFFLWLSGRREQGVGRKDGE